MTRTRGKLASPLPLRERVTEGRRSRARSGEGLSSSKHFSKRTPSPGSRSLSLPAIHPLPQGERGGELVAPMTSESLGCESRYYFFFERPPSVAPLTKAAIVFQSGSSTDMNCRPPE